MLSRGSQPECQMMRHPVTFSDPDAMEFEIGMRSSFVRQCLNEWTDSRVFVRNVENLYPANNTRYFVVSSLGKSTQLRVKNREQEVQNDAFASEPDAQFGVSGADQRDSADWNYDEQMLDAVPQPENVIDPILWCLKRRGIQF